LDWAAIVILPLIFAANALALVTLRGWLWFSVLMLQGIVIQLFGYVVHDLFIHRRVGGRAGYYIGALFELPITFRRTWHALYHIDHHYAMNTADDPEAYKQDLDNRLKRLFFLTLPGAMLTMARRLKPPNPASPHIVTGPLQPPTVARDRWRLQFERVLASCWMAALIAISLIWWQLPVLGYLLPLCLITPIMSGLRTVLEHAECDSENVFHCATFYRTGFLTGPLFLWDAGDCHLVHHIYPAIPFYRMRSAVKAISPILQAHGARERRSFFRILYGWFWRSEKHRTLWSV
jgi:fatty acid desaturase